MDGARSFQWFGGADCRGCRGSLSDRVHNTTRHRLLPAGVSRCRLAVPVRLYSPDPQPVTQSGTAALARPAIDQRVDPERAVLQLGLGIELMDADIDGRPVGAAVLVIGIDD